MTSTLLSARPSIAPPDESSAQRRKLVGTSVGLLAGGAAYFLTLLNFGTDLTRTTNASRIFSGFFDFQARAFLDGRVDISPELLGIEGFVHDGLTYTYFPPFPALLRLPVLMTTREFDNQLTLLSMALAWVVLAVVVSKLGWLALSLVTRSDEVSRTAAALVAIFIASATGGTVLTFDASLPWVYHEVYLWAVVGAVGACYWMVRALLHPAGHELRWLCAFTFVAIGTRATEGWAICLVVLALGVRLRLQRSDLGRRKHWWKFVLVAAVPLGASIALNLYKFDSVFMFPLQDQVWTQVNEQRRLALEANGGSLTGPQFFTTSFMAYLRPDGIRFVDYFPWITLPAEPAPPMHGAFVDQTYRTGSATSFMPLLMVLLLSATVACFRPRARTGLTVFRGPIVAGVLTTGGVMGYGYYSMRYTSDFVPALVVGGAVGTALLAGFVQERRAARAFALVVGTAVTLFTLVAQLAVGYYTTAIYYRGEPLADYVALQHRLSGDALADRVTAGSGFPTGGRTDDLAIRGDCETLFLHTGDLYEPWLPVEQRDRVITLTRAGDLEAGNARLLEVEGTAPMSIDLEVNERDEYRFHVRWDDNRVATQWVPFPPAGAIDIGIRNRLDVLLWEFTVPQNLYADVPQTIANLPSSYFDEDWKALEGDITMNDAATEWRSLGLKMSTSLGHDLALCRSLADMAGVDTTS